MATLVRDTIAPRRLIAIGAYFLGLLFSAAGAWLIYLGSRGSTEVAFLGQSVNSANGPAVLFLAAATVAGGVLLHLKSQPGNAGSSSDTKALGGPGLASFTKAQPASPSPAGEIREQPESPDRVNKDEHTESPSSASENAQLESPSPVAVKPELQSSSSTSENKPVIPLKEPSMGIDTQELKSKIKREISAHQSVITKLEDDLKTVEKVENLATELNVAEKQTAEAPGNGQPTEEEPAAKKKRAAAVTG